MNTSDYTPRLAGWHYAEKGLFKEAFEEEVYIYEFLGFYGGNSLYNLHNQSISFQNKVVKYWMSRTAPYYMFLYNIGFEMEEYTSVPSWPVDRATYIKSLDPWDHPITAHQTPSTTYRYRNSAVMDYTSMQYCSISNMHSMAVGVWNSPTKAVGHMNEGLWNGSWACQVTSESSARQAYWSLITGGMSYALIFTGNGAGKPPAIHANKFLKQAKWWITSPHDELVTAGTAYCLAKPGMEYIVYSKSGSSFSLSLPTGSYPYKWYNPVNGSFQAVQSVQSSGGSVVFNKPNSGEWVLHVGGAPPDNTPPTVPQNLAAVATSESQISLTWEASSDPESNISIYKILQDDVEIGQTPETSYIASGLQENHTYTYKVIAVNGALLESDPSSPKSATTRSDQTPPALVLVSALNQTAVQVIFSEKVEGGSAENTANYSIDKGIVVQSASLTALATSVVLTVTPLVEKTDYTLTVSNVTDVSSAGNVIQTVQHPFTYAGKLVITNINPSGYPAIIRNPGDSIYNDRNFTYTRFWNGYNQDDFLAVRTDNDDKNSTGSSFLSFEINTSAEVMVGLACGTPLSWMQGWINTGLTASGSHGETYTMFKKTFQPSTVTIGGNEGCGANMYTVFIKKADELPVIEEHPIRHGKEEFGLEVMPNPVNHGTTIRINRSQRTEDRGQISEIKIFNLTGKIVYQLTSDLCHLTSGLSWNASNQPSGVYIIRAKLDNKSITKLVLLQK
jgi:hypothetical protein